MESGENQGIRVETAPSSRWVDIVRGEHSRGKPTTAAWWWAVGSALALLVTIFMALPRPPDRGAENGAVRPSFDPEASSDPEASTGSSVTSLVSPPPLRAASPDLTRSARRLLAPPPSLAPCTGTLPTDPRSGALELRFHDRTGDPLAAVEVELVAPRSGAAEEERAGGERTETNRELLRLVADHLRGAPAPPEVRDRALRRVVARGRSDRHGRVQWTNLAAPASLEWCLLSEHVVVATVEEPTPRTSSLPDRLPPLANPTNSRARGGRVSLETDRQTTVEIELAPAGSIEGRLGSDAVADDAESRLPRAPGVVELLEERIAIAPDGEGVVDLLLLDRVEVPTDGRFRFAGVGAGALVVRARWSPDPHSVSFARRRVNLTAGEAIDLGLLDPPTADAQELRCTLHDVEGFPLPLGEVFTKGEASSGRTAFTGRMGEGIDAKTRLFVELLPADRHPAGEIAALLDVPLDRPAGPPFRLRGLPPGTLRLEPRPHPGWPRRLEPGWRIKLPRPREIALPAPGRVEMVLRGERVTAIRAPIVGLTAQEAGRAEALLFAEGSGALVPTRILPSRTGTDEALLVARGAPGSYRVLVRTDPDAGGSDRREPDRREPDRWNIGSTGAGLVGEARFEVGTEPMGAPPVRMVTGAILEGELAAGGERALTLAAWRDLGCRVAIWRLEGDRSGRFRIGGLPPRRELTVEGHGTFIAPAPGETGILRLGPPRPHLDRFGADCLSNPGNRR